MTIALRVYFVYESPSTKNVALQIRNFLVSLQQNSIEYNSFRFQVAKSFQLDKPVGYHDLFVKADLLIASVGQVLAEPASTTEQRLLIVISDRVTNRLSSKREQEMAISLIDRSGGNCVFLYRTNQPAHNHRIRPTKSVTSNNETHNDDLPRNVPSGLFLDKIDPIEFNLLWYQDGLANQVTMDSILSLCEILIESKPQSTVEWPYVLTWKKFPKAVLLMSRELNCQ